MSNFEHIFINENTPTLSFMADIKYFLKVARSEVKISEKEFRSGYSEHAKRRLTKLVNIIEQISVNDLKNKHLEEIKERIKNLLNQIN